MVMTPEKLMDVSEVCGVLGVHRNTVLRWLGSGELRGIKLGGPRAGWRVRPSELERFIRERETGHEQGQ